jgi:hypothetical protein
MIHNNTYKSLDYSKKEFNKSWGILSFNIVKRNEFDKVNSFCNMYLSRTILYIEKNDTVSQIGKLYLPLFSFKYLWFFVKLLFSRKSLGHFVNDKYGSNIKNVTFSVTNEYQSSIEYIVILNKKEYLVTERLIEIKHPKLELYVEEFK